MISQFKQVYSHAAIGVWGRGGQRVLPEFLTYQPIKTPEAARAFQHLTSLISLPPTLTWFEIAKETRKPTNGQRMVDHYVIPRLHQNEKACRVSIYTTSRHYRWHLPAAFCSLLWCTKFFSCSLHIAYRACSGFWATNSTGAGADCFFDWELASGRGRVAGWVPAVPKGAGSFLLS